MNTLNLGSDEIPATKKKSNTRNLKIALGLAAVILVPTIGSTLAGTIGVSAARVEFGQGLAQAAACDAEITLTPASAFINSAGAGSFKLGTLTVAGIADLCTLKVFKIKAWSDAGAEIAMSSGGASTGVAFTPTITDSACTVAAQASANHTVACTYSSNNNTVVVTVVSSVTDSIYKFTVETA